ncbi:MAG: L,D-transpeptidase family protein [Verrucomicrobia bacterium]|nr:L,D-transpeptidase family protein [Verrucomicrobiota bacterium]
MNYRFFMGLLRWGVVVLILPGTGWSAGGVPRDTGQVLVAIAKDWESDKALLWAMNRTPDGWVSALGEPIEVLLGRNGLAWGRGVEPAKAPDDRVKREGDRRTPAGLFKVGKIYGEAARLPGGGSYPYRRIGRWDAWVDDLKNPYYNQHYVAKPGRVPPWFESQRMRLGDAAYEFLIEIRHNADPPVPGYGSAIFFHIRRGEDRPSSGCTVMTRANLLRVIGWLRAEAKPHYVILPKAEYDRWQPEWQLPRFR